MIEKLIVKSLEENGLSAKKPYEYKYKVKGEFEYMPITTNKKISNTGEQLMVYYNEGDDNQVPSNNTSQKGQVITPTCTFIGSILKIKYINLSEDPVETTDTIKIYLLDDDGLPDYNVYSTSNEFNIDGLETKWVESDIEFEFKNNVNME